LYKANVAERLQLCSQQRRLRRQLQDAQYHLRHARQASRARQAAELLKVCQRTGGWLLLFFLFFCNRSFAGSKTLRSRPSYAR
jgi:hypothetical protein